jgi:ppGpp synthetase/RelA/SpoT-type nucleotidyltranferase
MRVSREDFLIKYHLTETDITSMEIEWETIDSIYSDYNIYRNIYETQANFIASTLRTHDKIHSVKSRVKEPEHLIEKIIRKTPDRKRKCGKNFRFTIDNYKEQITDLIGVRAIHIFKDDWEEIHKFIISMWKVVEITANVREGDDTKRFEELNIQIHSRKSGYRSVHYLIESFPTNHKVIAEIQVRTIFEEGYGEIDHQLRYSHSEIPEVLRLNLLLLNRIAGSSDEMASLINMLNRNWTEMEKRYEKIIDNKNKEIMELKSMILNSSNIEVEDKKEILKSLDKIVMKDDLANLADSFGRTFVK